MATLRKWLDTVAVTFPVEDQEDAADAVLHALRFSQVRVDEEGRPEDEAEREAIIRAYKLQGRYDSKVLDKDQNFAGQALSIGSLNLGSTRSGSTSAATAPLVAPRALMALRTAGLLRAAVSSRRSW